MIRTGKTWTLHINGRECGRLVLQDVDQPWYECVFYPTPNFDAYSATFHMESLMLNVGTESEWEALFDKISLWHIELIGDDGDKVDQLVLHINDKNMARLRY